MDVGRLGAFARFFPQAKVELKFGVERRSFPLIAADEGDGRFSYRNEWIELRGEVERLDDGMRYSLRLKNIGRTSFRLTRLRFPAGGGLGSFLEGTDPRKVAFLRNGYQSWSTARSYRVTDKPLRPRFRLVSLASSNMANLPSNSPGQLSSEMYTVIMDLQSGRSLLVGQELPFDQFFYVILNIDHRGESYFEIIYDFGRQLLNAGKEIELDGIVIRYGSRPLVEQFYFWGLRERLGYAPPQKRPSGWCSWYEYYAKITPEDLFRNLQAIKDRGLDLDIFQIDDGWQSAVGDWLEVKPAFRGRMRELSDAVRAAGMRPGIWFAPFSATADSELARLHPEYVLKNDWGRRLPAGYNPYWNGFYYGLDVTHPDFNEYLREVVRTITQDWGFEILKCDFLFSACLRGACHQDLSLSRAQVLKAGMRTIREAAGPDVKIMGCGMPLSAGIGLVDSMRVGPDTGGFWIKLSGKLLRTGAMIGARNSLRNFMVRSPMHKRLWLNDPDCAILRDRGTRLSPAERRSQLDAVALSGGPLMFSDDFSDLTEAAAADLRFIDSVSAQCYKGQPVAIDAMEKEMPEIYYNTTGYVVFFNFSRSRTRRYDLTDFKKYEPRLTALVDLRTGERFPAGDVLVLPNIGRHGSRLFRVERSDR